MHALRGKSRWLNTVAIMAAVTLVFSACARRNPVAQREGAVEGEQNARQSGLVVTTVAPITSIVKAVAGDDLQVKGIKGILPEGEDSHTFEQRAAEVAQDFAAADLIIFNGLALETPAIEMAKKTKRPNVKVLLLAEETITPDAYVFDFSFPREKGDPNPHLWLNPMYAARYAEIVANNLAEIFPDKKSNFLSRYQAYRELLNQLDEAIFESLATVPPQNRKLLTYHDSFAYFAPRYGFQVIGAIQPSDFSEPSAAEVAAIIEQIKRERVPAIFGSKVFPSPVMEKIAKETGAKYVTDLSDDTLPGDPRSPEHNYVGMMVRDVEIITSSLGGDPSPLRRIDVSKGGRWD